MKLKILLTVKTYPTISIKHESEIVCTAGLTEEGDWIRLYPVRYRNLPDHEKYLKFQWIEVQAKRKKTDFRPETFIPQGEFKILGEVDTGKNRDWAARKDLVLKNVFHSFDDILAVAKDKNKNTSLAVFKPKNVRRLVIEKEEQTDWTPNQKDALRKIGLFENNGAKIEVVKKLPYSFSYEFEDSTGRLRKLNITEWELGALYWNCLRDADGNDQQALSKVHERYFDDFVTNKDLHLFVGSHFEHHQRGFDNPFMIVGTFRPPKTNQMSFDLKPPQAPSGS